MTNITKLYQQLQEGKTTREYFVREARRQFPQFISPVTSFTDAVNILKSKRLVSENVIKEVSGAFFDAPPMKETHKLDTEQILDRMSPYAVKKGVEAELKKEKTYDNTTIDKVKTRVAKKLKKNPNAYDDQIIANVKKVEKQDKELEATELKKELVDKKNAMRKPKGFKADKANTKVSKRENRKGKPKGVKVMPDKGVTGTEKVIKEDVIQNLKEWLQENIMREYHPNMEVKTPYGDGVVKEIRGGTLTVELADKRLVDVQFNVVNELMDKANEPQQTEIEPSFKDEPEEQPEMTKAERDAAWAKIGRPMGSVEGPSTGVPKSLYSAMTQEEKIAAIVEKLNKMEEGEKKEKIKEMIKSKLKEAKALVVPKTATDQQVTKIVSTDSTIKPGTPLEIIRK